MSGGGLTRVRLSAEELAERAQQLAEQVRALGELEEEQKDARADMAREKKLAQRRVRDAAEIVRTGVEDRPLQVGLFDEQKDRGPRPGAGDEGRA